MKSLLIFGAIIGLIALLFSMSMMFHMVETIPSTSSSGDNLFKHSVNSTVNYLAIPIIFLLGLSFLAFLVWMFKMRG
jgi:hypothetical protein